MTTGDEIKAARKKAGMSQQELANKLGVSYQSIGQWERNVRNPKPETLRKIANALNVTPLYCGASVVLVQNPPDGVEQLYKINDEECESKELDKFLHYLDMLNDEGQKKALERIQELTEIPRYQKYDKMRSDTGDIILIPKD